MDIIKEDYNKKDIYYSVRDEQGEFGCIKYIPKQGGWIFKVTEEVYHKNYELGQIKSFMDKLILEYPQGE